MNDKSNIDRSSMTDKALIEFIGAFLRHHRLNQNRSQEEIANAAGLSRSTVSLLERGENTSLSSLIQVLRVLDLLHVMEVFEVKNEISPVEYARLQKDKRKRARNVLRDSDSEKELEW